MKNIKEWLAQNNYEDVLKKIHAVELGWKRKGTGTRRDWWEVLAGNLNGSPKIIEGKKFPVLRAARIRKGWPVTEEFISDKFVGYSVNHVNGRYKATEIKTMQEAFRGGAASAERYLVDETTAVVRFIFPCKAETEEQENALLAAETPTAEQEAKLIRWFFRQLFVQSILEVVNAEDEIWLLETGMQNCLHIWRAKD
jgi:hypothetical protein